MKTNLVGEKSSVNFRIFKATDQQELLKMMRNLNQEDSQELPLTKDKIEALLRENKKNPNLKIFVAELNQKIIGYAILAKNFSVEITGPYAEFDQLYIKKEFRNKGIGTEFLKYLEIFSLQLGCRVSFMVVTMNNVKAQKLYQSLGYKKQDHLNFYKELG